MPNEKTSDKTNGASGTGTPPPKRPLPKLWPLLPTAALFAAILVSLALFAPNASAHWRDHSGHAGYRGHGGYWDHSGYKGHGGRMVPIQHHSPSGVPISGVFEGYGTIKSVDTEKLSLVMDHGPIPAIGWGPMVMGFKVKDKSLLEGLAAGDKVRFDLQVDSGDYYIVDMEAQ